MKFSDLYIAPTNQKCSFVCLRKFIRPQSKHLERSQHPPGKKTPAKAQKGIFNFLFCKRKKPKKSFMEGVPSAFLLYRLIYSPRTRSNMTASGRSRIAARQAAAALSGGGHSSPAPRHAWLPPRGFISLFWPGFYQSHGSAIPQ